MTGPLITVVTATWKRPDVLLECCIPSVRAQTYQPLEHLVVVDGPDVGLAWRLEQRGYRAEPGHGLRVVELGRNWGGVGHAAHAAGAWLAAGEWICYLDDDNQFHPEHVERMVREAVTKGVDLVCTAWKVPGGLAGGWTPDGRPPTWATDGAQVCGWTPPGTNHTDTSSFLHRRELLNVASWDPGCGYAADGALIDRWMAAGVRWSFLTEPTMIYGGARGGAPE